MLNAQYIRSLMTYFAGFVSADAISKLGKLPKPTRLKNVEIGYNFSKKKLLPNFIQSARIT